MSDKGFKGNTLSLILAILVTESIYLAIFNKNNHTAYFELVKTAIVYSFGLGSSKGTFNRE
ncbi:hypothetical protein NIES21_50260 [Anabaenopsis circularis NIES-21]|uniref:Uncharacterized protein n=1 Tax=Anabaenopsis circularis NIES-21 TaxID=1085406 RepID=A0A1Z4GPB2_9CYAN|nr:hypothetical protein NIES21_50260 [Anabaenopsis circularis NIES-21]